MLTSNLQRTYPPVPTTRPVPTAPAPLATPTQFRDVGMPSPLTDPNAPFTDPGSAPPVVHQDVSATSTSGAPFGYHAVLTPEQQATLIKGLSNLTYSVPQGGYVFNDPRHPEGYARSLVGGDPAANRAAAALYGTVGAAPTAPNITGALQNLYARTGQSPTLGPSFNERLAGTGLEGPYLGPYTTPGYDPFKKFRSLYGG
jgi:hypothetical protein